MINSRQVHLFDQFVPDAVLQRLILFRCLVIVIEPENSPETLVLMGLKFFAGGERAAAAAGITWSLGTGVPRS